MKIKFIYWCLIALLILPLAFNPSQATEDLEIFLPMMRYEGAAPPVPGNGNPPPTPAAGEPPPIPEYQKEEVANATDG